MNYFRNRKGTVYKQESKWRTSRNNISKDIKGNDLPYPKHSNKEWQNKRD